MRLSRGGDAVVVQNVRSAFVLRDVHASPRKLLTIKLTLSSCSRWRQPNDTASLLPRSGRQQTAVLSI